MIEQFDFKLDEFFRTPKERLKLEKILDEVSKYDLTDFLKKVSALNLVVNNQNKGTILSCIIGSILTLSGYEQETKPLISSGKFRKIISMFEDLSISKSVDPPENLFIERVMFFKNYRILTGICYAPSYTIQMLIKSLFLHENSIDQLLLRKIARIFRLVLELSEYVVQSVFGDQSYIVSKNDSSIISIPSSLDLNRLINFIEVDEEYINGLLENDEELLNLFYTQFGDNNIDDVLSCTRQMFHSRPFLKCRNDKIILLDVTVLASFAFHQSLVLAEKYGYLNLITNQYNKEIWSECKKSLFKLGHQKIVEKQFSIELKDERKYKELVLNVGNNQFLLVTAFFDIGEKFKKDEIFGECPMCDSGQHLKLRYKYILDQFSKSGISKNDVYHITILSSFGRNMGFTVSGFDDFTPMVFSPLELKCIAINEKRHQFFLPKYIKCKSNLLNSEMSTFIGELNCLEVYVSNDYSFYINDKYNPKTNILYFYPGESVNYIHRALIAEDRKLVESYDEGFMVEVMSGDKYRNIFYEDAITRQNNFNTLVTFKNLNIWIYCLQNLESDKFEIFYVVADIISYWLSECSDLIETMLFSENYLLMEINIIGNEIEYYKEIENKIDVSDAIDIQIETNRILLTIKPALYQYLNSVDNSREKCLIETIYRSIAKISTNCSEVSKLMSSIFSPSYKKKFMFFDIQHYRYLKPLKDNKIREIQSSDENRLLDEIGESVLKSGSWSYGAVPQNERSKLSKYIVSYLYNRLEAIISNLNPKSLIEIIYYDLEKTIHNIQLQQRKFAFDIACYPEKKQSILDSFNEINKSSISLRFLIEYVSAIPSKGNRIIGELEYDNLIAICFLIIDWAYKDDLFHFRIFDTPIEILESNRIGLKHTEFNSINNIVELARSNQMEYNSIPKAKKLKIGTQYGFSKQEKFQELLDDAFRDEFGYSFSEFSRVTWSLIDMGEEHDSEIKVFERCFVLERLAADCTDISSDLIEMIIVQLSLCERDNFLMPGQPYKPQDAYPWRFNRELSFTRKPLISRGNQLIWGTRNLNHMLFFTQEMIYEGKLKARKQKLIQFQGKLSDERGNEFNTKVFNILSSFDDLKVYKKVEWVNGKRISDDLGNVLGDIDVVYISIKRSLIVLVEVKDFSISKNPYELYNEYQDMFVDQEKRKSYSTKHRIRHDWVCKNLKDILVEFKLPDRQWRVERIFIVSHQVVSNGLLEVKERIIPISDVTLKNLLKF